MTASDLPSSRVVTFGCRLNAAESEMIRTLTEAADDVVVVNTCAVTGEAERQARQTIRRLRRERPDARIVVTGCAAQIHPEMFAAMPEVDQVLGNTEKLRAESFAAPMPDQVPDRVMVADIMAERDVAEHPISGFDGRARAFVEVQQGCDHRCTFCVIPYGRGPNRSVPAERVIAQVRTLVEAGFAEVVLTGVDITGYGTDAGASALGGLVRRVLAEVPDLARLRLSSLDPVEIDGELLRAVAEEERLMPHFHLSVQAGDDLVLRRMARRHRRADVLTLAARLRELRGAVTLGADLIAGFPTEDEDMAKRSLDLVEEGGFTHLHVFPFSPRPGTPAAAMPPVPGRVVRDRAAALRARGEAALAAFRAGRVGSAVTVLVEADNQGFCERYLPVRLTRPAAPGALIAARVMREDGNVLIAEEGA